MEIIESGIWIGEKILIGALSSMGGSLYDLGLNEVFTAINHTSEIEEFKQELFKKMDNYESKLNDISLKIDWVQQGIYKLIDKISVVKDDMKSMEQHIIYQTVKSEISVRMTIINTYISKIEYLFEICNKLFEVLGAYKTLTADKNYSENFIELYDTLVRISILNQRLRQELDKNSIPQMLYYIHSELVEDAGGSKDSILKIMHNHFKSKYPFVQSYCSLLYKFANFMATIQVQGLYLYYETCCMSFNSKQRIMAFEEEYQKLKERLSKQRNLLPDEKYASFITKYDDENQPLHYRLTLSTNGLTLNFCSERIPVHSFKMLRYPGGEYKEYLNDPDSNFYQAFFSAKNHYPDDKNLSNQDFLNKYLGGVVKLKTFSVKSEIIEIVPRAYRDFEPVMWIRESRIPIININTYERASIPFDFRFDAPPFDSDYYRAWITAETPKPYQYLIQYTSFYADGTKINACYGMNSTNNYTIKSFCIGISISLRYKPKDAHIEYCVYDKDAGWSKYVQDGEFAGFNNSTNGISGMKVRLVNLPGYHVFYETSEGQHQDDQVAHFNSNEWFRMRVIEESKVNTVFEKIDWDKLVSKKNSSMFF